MAVIKAYGRDWWARNEGNLKYIQELDPHGVYVLCDGSTPIYVGRGRIRDRLADHCESDRKTGCWDHFRWFEVPARHEQDVEALLIRLLPFYLRSLNNQGAQFERRKRGKKQRDPKPDPIKRPKVNPYQKRKRQ